MEDTKRKLVKREANWHWEDYLKEADWFARICNLPDQGLLPNEIPNNLVSPTMLQECFGRRAESGYKLHNCKLIPQIEIKKLLQVVDGHQSPLNSLLSTTIAKGLYADRLLNVEVNWAGYAHTKHKNQLQLAWKRGRSAPDGPPLLRHPLRYESPPPMKDSHGAGLVETPTGSQFPLFTNAGAGTDKTRRVSKNTVAAKGKAPIPLRPGNCCKLEPDVSSPAGNGTTGFPSQKPLLSILTPAAIKLEISRMIRIQKRFQDDISTLRGMLDLVSKKERTEFTGMDDSYRQVAEEAEQYFSTVNCGEERNSEAGNGVEGNVGQSNEDNNAAHEEVSDADLGGTSARTHDKYKSWIREYGFKTVAESKKEGCEIHLSPSAAQLVENLMSGGNETSRSSSSIAKGPHQKENVVRREIEKDANKSKSKMSPSIDAVCTQNNTRPKRKNKAAPVTDVSQFPKLPRKRKPS